MDRRTFIVSVAGPLVARPAGAAMQQAGKIWRIGHLSLVSESLAQYRPWVAALYEGLRNLGYVEGDNVISRHRYAAGQIGRLPAMAAELVGMNVDVLVTAPAGSAFAAKKVTSTIPIVFVGEPDPVGTGLVASLAHPGGNVTGLADAHADLVPKRLELLKQVIAPSSRVGVLRNSANPSTAPQLKTAQAAARALGLTLFPVDVKDPGRDDLDHAFATIGQARLGGLLVIADPTLGVQRDRIADLSLKHRLPTSGTHRGWTEGNLLMSYGSDFADMFRRSATLVDKIFKGAKPADLPVEQPTKFEFVINLRTARALGLMVPASLLTRADHVIQ